MMICYRMGPGWARVFNLCVNFTGMLHRGMRGVLGKTPDQKMLLQEMNQINSLKKACGCPLMLKAALKAHFKSVWVEGSQSAEENEHSLLCPNITSNGPYS